MLLACRICVTRSNPLLFCVQIHVFQDTMAAMRHRLPMPSTETDRWKKNPPKELLNTYPSGQFKKAGHSTLNTMISDSVWDPMNMQTSGAGRVAGGLNDSVGFMHTQSTAKAAQQQALDEDTLDAWNKGRQVCSPRTPPWRATR